MFAISHCRKELVCKKKASISCMIFKHANDLFMWVNSSFLADFYSILSNEMTFLRRLCREDIYKNVILGKCDKILYFIVTLEPTLINYLSVVYIRPTQT